MAYNSVHGVAFHRGLGTSLHPTSSTPIASYLNEEYLKDYASAVYAKSNIAVVANGADHSELSKWVGEFFTDVPSTAASDLPKIDTTPTKYYGGEERIAHAKGNTQILAFPGSSSFTAGSSYKPEIGVLAQLLGGQSSIKWSPGFSILSKASAAYPGVSVSTETASYSDAGLLYVTLKGSAKGVQGASHDVVKALKSVAAGEVSAEDIKKAVALAKFKALESAQSTEVGIEATGQGLISGEKAYQLSEIAESVGSVGPEQVKKVSDNHFRRLERNTNITHHRLRKLSLTERPQSHQWEISTSFLSPRNSVLTSRLSSKYLLLRLLFLRE
jgi:ubiquinol-cytochrome c reductase core subunit 2